jgi:pimeloyl-ACP methyl ester carboxylesterase
MSSGSDPNILLRDGRRLGYAEYGDLQGKTIFLFHGTPGSRMLHHPDGSIALSCNARLIVPERPGMGLSDFQEGRRLLDWPADVVELADALEVDRFAVAGHSGGGPYAAACGFVIPERLRSVGLISGIGPIDAPGVLEGMLSANRMGYAVGRWMPWMLWCLVFKLYYGDYARHPEKLAAAGEDGPGLDQKIMAEPGIRQMYIENFSEAFRQGTTGAARDGWLFTRPWGFALEEISVPVHLWQGEEDLLVTPAMGRYMATCIPQCDAKFYPGEGHLVFIRHWQDILRTLTGERLI